MEKADESQELNGSSGSGRSGAVVQDAGDSARTERGIPGSGGTRALMAASIFGTAAIVVLIQVRTWVPGMPRSLDTPYHIGMADLFRKAALRRTFPWTQLSVWRDTFYDKELGFHLILAAVRRWAGLLGIGGGRAPFALEMGVLLMIYGSVLAACLRGLKARFAAVAFPLGFFACPLFLARISMVRPQVMSVVLVLAAVLVLCRTEGTRRIGWLVALGVLFAYCHSNPHFILFPTACYALLQVRREGVRSAVPAAAGLAGVVLGLTVHPQVPNTFLLWKIQCIDVVWQALTHTVPGMQSPSELGPPNARVVVYNSALFVLLAAALFGTWRAYRKNMRFRLAPSLCTVMAVVSCLGFLVSKRAIEYAVPCTVLAAALQGSRVVQKPRLSLHWGLLAAILLAGYVSVPVQTWFSARRTYLLAEPFARWARENFPAGTYIGNLWWDDFPNLFYCAPEFRYSAGLDPMFFYRAEPEKFAAVEKLCAGNGTFPPQTEMRELMGTPYVFVSTRFPGSARRMAVAHYPIIYQGPDGWLFNLKLPPADHNLD